MTLACRVQHKINIQETSKRILPPEKWDDCSQNRLSNFSGHTLLEWNHLEVANDINITTQ